MSSFVYASVLGLVMASASALPDRHLTRIDRDRFEGLADEEGEYEYDVDTKKDTNFQIAEASCSVNTFTKAYSGYKDSFIKVVVDVYKNACGEDFSATFIKGQIFSFAEVWAAATAEAYVDCYSSASEDGHAEACGFGDAAAKASNFALASAYAKATAEVVDKHYCECGKAEIWTRAQASLFQVLTADVFARASAAACVKGNDYASAFAYVDCYASVFTELFAEAIAGVVIDGSCYYGDGADVYAYVDSISYEFSQCKKISGSTDGAEGNAEGDHSTSS